MKTAIKKSLITAAAGSILVTAILGGGLLQRPDKWVQDTLYQRGGVSSGDIVIIGIDEDALAELGPYNTWDRNVMASALEMLAADPDNKPAVVAIDTLYVGESDPEADARLVNACESLGNVVTATAAEFGSVSTVEDGEYVTDSYHVINYEEPFEALKEVTTQGHINAMEDMDGVMRHAVLYVQPENEAGEKVYSMASETARIFLEQQGMEITYPETNSRGHFYVPFTAEPGDFYDGISLADLIDGEVPSDYFAGKIVLIGPYASGLQDAYFTPIARSTQMFGVEFQANVIQSLIDGNFKTEVSTLPQTIVLFIVAFVAMYIFTNRKVGFSGVICVGIVVLSLILSVALYSVGWVTHPLWIPVGVVALYIVSVIIHYVQAAAAKRKVYTTFERYVAPEVVKELMKEGTDSIGLGGKLCDIAVLFVDVRGFTTMSERLDPERVVFILNKILTMTSSCIEKNHGTLDKFVGDATMAFWGAPLPQEDSVFWAAKTALDIVDGAEEVSRQLKEEIGEEFHVGVGVHFGPAVVGNIGSEKHMDYTAIGDTVNTSARLEANAPGGTVYISRVVADKLGSRAVTKSLGGSVKLKGKAEGFEVLILESLEGR